MATHAKKGPGCIVHFKLTTDSTWRLLHGLTTPQIPTGEPDEIEFTNHGTLNNIKEKEHGLIDVGSLVLGVQLNLNKAASAPTGEDPLNELQADLLASVGANVVWDVRIALPKAGTAPSSYSATPPTDRPYFTGTVIITSFPIDIPVSELMETEITCLAKSRFTLTRVA